MNFVLVGNGNPPPFETLRRRLREADRIIAIDGGARFLKQIGARPHMVIGDLDSIEKDLLLELQSTSMIYRFSQDKDDTDLNLARLEAERSGAKRIEVFSWADERLDYSLGALMDLSHSNAEIECFGHRSLVFILNKHRPFLKLTEAPGSRISIFPLETPLSLKTKGLKWDFDWKKVAGPCFSQSNEIQSEAELRLSAGRAFVLLQRAHV